MSRESQDLPIVRPSFAEIIGQEQTLTRLKSFAELYVKADKPTGHLLLTGPEHHGKRTIARAFADALVHPDQARQRSQAESWRAQKGLEAYEVEAFGFIVKDASDLERAGSLTAPLTSLEASEALVILNIDRLRKPIAEILIPALRDFEIGLIIGQGQGARLHAYRLNQFTCIATTTSEAECPRDLLEVFPLRIALQPYPQTEMERLTAAIALESGLRIPLSVVTRVAKASGGSPHQAEVFVQQFKRMGGDTITEEQAAHILSVLGISSPVIQSIGMAQNPLELSGIEFERLITTLLQRMNFRAEMTKASGDGGIDIVADLESPLTGGRFLIQCKRLAPDCMVGAPTVREFYGALVADRKAIKGILITTSNFTTQAREFAEGLPLELIDGGQLKNLLAIHRPAES